MANTIANTRIMTMAAIMPHWLAVNPELEALSAVPIGVTMYGHTDIPAFCKHVAIDTAIADDVTATEFPAPVIIHGIQIENARPQINAPIYATTSVGARVIMRYETASSTHPTVRVNFLHAYKLKFIVSYVLDSKLL